MENFCEKAHEILQEISQNFQKQADHSLVIGSEWTFYEQADELEKELKARVEEARSNQLELVQKKVDV